jgi:hypothetical protein
MVPMDVHHLAGAGPDLPTADAHAAMMLCPLPSINAYIYVGLGSCALWRAHQSLGAAPLRDI